MHEAQMRGAVAAGHRLTAEAGARALAEGGNAVEACVAAAFASWVAESPLTGPGGGGFMLVHTARDRRARVLDFFVAAPGIGFDDPARAAMHAGVVDFADAGTQLFRIGPASCPAPGLVARPDGAHRGVGVLTPEDLARYRVIRRRAVRGSFRGHELLSSPPPSSGGALIGYGLRLLEAIGQEAEGSAESVAAMVEVMREQARVRGGRFATYLHRGGLPRRLEAEVETALERIRSGVPGAPELAPAGTTHISVVDAA